MGKYDLAMDVSKRNMEKMRGAKAEAPPPPPAKSMAPPAVLGDDQWAAKKAPVVYDQADPRSIQVHPSAEGVKEAYARMHQKYGFDGRFFTDRIIRLNAVNLNLFMNSFRANEADWMKKGAHTKKAMDMVKIKLMGVGHADEATANTGLRWWQDPTAAVDTTLKLVGSKDRSALPSRETSGGSSSSTARGRSRGAKYMEAPVGRLTNPAAEAAIASMRKGRMAGLSLDQLMILST